MKDLKEVSQLLDELLDREENPETSLKKGKTGGIIKRSATHLIQRGTSAYQTSWLKKSQNCRWTKLPS